MKQPNSTSAQVIQRYFAARIRYVRRVRFTPGPSFVRGVGAVQDTSKPIRADKHRECAILQLDDGVLGPTPVIVIGTDADPAKELICFPLVAAYEDTITRV